jgi:hypothetical protein
MSFVIHRADFCVIIKRFTALIFITFRTLVAVTNCVNGARAECTSEELEMLPPEFEKSINLLSEMVNFICVAELHST